MDFDYTHCNAITNCERMQAHFKKRSAGFGSPLTRRGESRRNRHGFSGSHRLRLQFFGGSNGGLRPAGFREVSRSSNPFEPPPSFGSEGVGCCNTDTLEAAMAHIYHLGTSASARPLHASIPLAANLAITCYSLDEVDQRLRALAAVQQLLRVPVPEDDEADSGCMRHVWRADLAALLGVVCESLADKVAFATKMAEVSLAQAREVRP